MFKRKLSTNLKLKDSGPLFLTGLSMCGVIFTAAAAIHDTPKALRIIRREEDDRKFKVKVFKNENGDILSEKIPYKELTNLDKVKLTWKCYIPTILVAASTCFCIGYSNKLNNEQKKRLLAAYALTHAAYREYRDKVVDILGPEGEAELKSTIAQDHIKDETHYGNGKPEEKTVIFIDEFMNTKFESTKEAVLAAEYEMNRTFALRGHVSMGDFYRYLGLDDVYADQGPLLERFGWSYDMGTDMGYEWIDFSNRKVEDADVETYTIGYPFEPVLGYLYG